MLLKKPSHSYQKNIKNKLIFSIKETTQGSNKKEHGPYLGEKIKLKKPLKIKYEGKNKPVIIKYETKIHLVKDYKQKGGVVTNAELSEFEKKMKGIQYGISEESFKTGENGYLSRFLKS